MNVEQRRAVVRELEELEGATLESKGTAYAGTVDTLANFKSVAERTGATKYEVWLVFVSKHIMSIENAIKQNPERPAEKSEGFPGRILDVRVYMSLLACLLYEDGLFQPEEENA